MSEYKKPTCKYCGKEGKLLRSEYKEGKLGWTLVEEKPIYLMESTGQKDEDGKWIYKSKCYHKQHTCPESEKARADKKAEQHKQNPTESDKPPF